MEKDLPDETAPPAKEEGCVSRTISIRKTLDSLVQDRIRALGVTLSFYTDQCIRKELGLPTFDRTRKRVRTKKKPPNP